MLPVRSALLTTPRPANRSRDSCDPIGVVPHRQLQIYGIVTRKGLTTPVTRRVASICSLGAGTVYIVLRGSPTGSITLVSSLREIPTLAVLHHPFLFGEMLT